MPRKPKSPPLFKVRVNSIVDIEAEVNEWFNAGLADYCTRFKVSVLPERLDADIRVSLVCMNSDNSGMCAYETRTNSLKDNKIIFIQARCLALSEEVFSFYSTMMMAEVIAHEFVHCYQALTGRKGVSTEYMATHHPSEEYYFDPEEQEARLLQAFYAHAVGKDIVRQIFSIYEDFGSEEVEL